MIKAGSFFRKTVVAQLEKAFAKSDSIFVLGYSGLTSIQMTELRTLLRQNQSRIFVTKNSLMHRALKLEGNGGQPNSRSHKDSNIGGLDNLISGSTALVFSSQDIAAIAKALIKFAKAHQGLVLKGALSRPALSGVNQRLFDNKALETLSRLPSKETLRAQVVEALKSPLAGLVWTLKGNLNKLVLILNQIKDKR